MPPSPPVAYHKTKGVVCKYLIFLVTPSRSCGRPQNMILVVLMDLGTGVTIKGRAQVTKGGIMLGIITAMALVLSLILGLGPAWGQTPPPSPIYQPLNRQTKGPLDRSLDQSTKNAKDQKPLIQPNFPQATQPMPKQPFAKPQNSPGQPGSGKSWAKKPASQVPGPVNPKAGANIPDAGFTPAWKPSYKSSPQPGGLSAGFGLGRRTPGAAGLAPLSAYLQESSIGNCFESYLQSGFTGRKSRAAAAEDSRLPAMKKQRQAQQNGQGLFGKSNRNY
jgi:hypothetical protein